MADTKAKVKRMGELQAILAGPEETSEILKPVRTVSEEEMKNLEDHDIGQSDNKSGRGMGWYVVHTYSGYEKKVKETIENVVENRHLENKILEDKVPMQEVVELSSKGKKTVQKKSYPGYVWIHMDADDSEAWYVVRNTRGVTGFVGPGSKPVPLEDYEIEKIDQDKVAQVEFEKGDTIMITDGAWKDTIGNVSRIDENKQTVTIMVEMFGRETPVEIGFYQVKKID